MVSKITSGAGRLGRLLLLATAFIGLPGRSLLASPPGVLPPPATIALHEFLLPSESSPLTVSHGAPELFKRKSSFTRQSIRLADDPEGRVMVEVATEIGGSPIGVPALMTLGEFAAYKHSADRQQLLKQRLGEPVLDTEYGGALLNIKIPVNVPPVLNRITGQGESNIRITGRRRIDLSGVSRYTEGQAQSAGLNTSRIPLINFEQESQLNVQGTIGERISIELQQDSRSQLDLRESIRLRYTGVEDDIIQEIEAGSTSLSLPGTRLVGFNAPNRGGLFGIKARGKLGGLNVTMVTTQDKAASGRKTFQGRTEETSSDTRDYQYLEDRYFFLDEIYRNAYPNQPADQSLVNVQFVRVFVNDFIADNDLEDKAEPGVGFALWDPQSPREADSRAILHGGVEEGNFHELEDEDFDVDPRGYLVMRSRVSRGHALAVAYQTIGGDFFGDIGQSSSGPRQLKLVKARNQSFPISPDDYPTWQLAWRNVYSLGGRNIEPGGLDVAILRTVSGQEDLDNQDGTPYIQIFELDTHRNGSAESTPPDNLIDIDGGANIPGVNLAGGHLIFRTLEPFGERGLGAEALDDEARVPGIYRTTNSKARSDSSRFLLRVRSRGQSTQYSLGFGVVENSEEIILNNKRLQKGKDYSIDYQFGQVRMLGESEELAADPTANLIINYAEKDALGLGSQQKSLLGVRAEYPLKNNSLLGLTILYSSQNSPSQRVQVGQEPTRTFIWDANAQLRYRPKFLTEWANKLPSVSTTTGSTVDLDIEIAQSLPNPNTKDVAYIDDFEGAESLLAFPISKLAWIQSSKPERTASSTSAFQRGRLTWYNPVERDRVRLSQIQPGRTDITAGQDIVDIMVLRFEPKAPGGRPEHSWGGIMRFEDIGLDFSRSKFLEIWIKGDAGKLHIDLGDISERVSLHLDEDIVNAASAGLLNIDSLSFQSRGLEQLVNPDPNSFRSEDTPLGGLSSGDNITTPDEDIGLDGLTDDQEAEIYRILFPATSVPADPSRDNFADIDFDQSNIDVRYPPGVNGTEGNNPERNSFPDTEDLNKNGILDTEDDFVRYSVELFPNKILGFNPDKGVYDDSLSVVVEGSQSNFQGGETERGGWRLIRIPLRGRDAPRTSIGRPDTTFSNPLEFVRLWVEHNNRSTIEIYTLDAIGSEWQEDPSPYEFKVASIGTANPIYDPPPGLELEHDPTTGVILLERSLTMEFRGLPPGESLSASRTFLQAGNYTRYGGLTMFVHGGPTFPAPIDTIVGTAHPVELSLRMTSVPSDTTNFYEYRAKIYQDWTPELNTFDLNLELMTQLKGHLLDLRASQRVTSDTTVVLSIGEQRVRYNKELNEIEMPLNGKIYAIRGNPSLSSIKSFSMILTNLSETRDLTGELWTDELRVTDIRKKKAVSALMDFRAVIADLANFSVKFERRSGDFQSLTGQASGRTTTLFSVNSEFKLGRFLPVAWNTSFPVRVGYNRSGSVPRIRSGSDIVLTEEQKGTESDVRSQSRFNVSFRKNPAKEEPTLASRLVFDRITASLNILTNSTESGAITRRSLNSTETLSGNFSYDLNWSKRGSLKPMGWIPFFTPLKEAEFFYLPSNVRYSLKMNRNVRDSESFSAVGGDTTNVIDTRNETFVVNETYSVKFKPFKSLTADYELRINRDLRDGFSFASLQFGRETGRSQVASFRYAPRIFRWLNFNAQFTANYRELLETGGERATYGTVRRGLRVTRQNPVSGRFTFNIPSLVQPLLRPSKDGGFSIRRNLGRFISTLQSVQVSLTRSKTFTLFGLQERPEFGYQFAFKDTTEAERFESGLVTRVDTRQIQDRIDLTGSLRLPAGIQIQTGLDFTHTRNPSGTNRTEDDRLVFPTINAGWKGLERLPVLRALFRSSRIDFGYKVNNLRRGDGGLDTLGITQDSKLTEFRPLFNWNASWNNRMSTTFTRNKSENVQLKYERNVAGEDVPLVEREIGTTITNSATNKATLKYTLSSRLFKKLQSNLDMDLAFQQTGSLQEEFPRATVDDTTSVIRKDEGSWSAQLQAQYRFSSRFTGGSRVRHESRKDRLRDRTDKTWEFRVWGEIQFN